MGRLDGMGEGYLAAYGLAQIRSDAIEIASETGCVFNKTANPTQNRNALPPNQNAATEAVTRLYNLSNSQKRKEAK